MEVALEARMHIWRLTKEQAKSPDYGSVLQILHLREIISHRQYEAGNRYREIMDAYLATASLPDGRYKCIEAGHIGSTSAPPVEETTPDAIRKAQEAARRAKRLLEAIQALNTEDFAIKASKGLTAANIIWAVCMTECNQRLDNYELGLLREGLNAVDRTLSR